MFLLTQKGICCLDASQDRIIPLGTLENCMIAIELNSTRSDKRDGSFEESWMYTLKLKIFNDDYSTISIKEFEKLLDISKDDKIPILQRHVSEALEICYKMKDFEIFQIKSIELCDFQKDCGSIKLRNEKKGLHLYDDTLRKSSFIHVLDTTSVSELGKFYRDYKAYLGGENTVDDILSISSIRRYENSKYSLLAFQLGTGDIPSFINEDTVVEKTIKRIDVKNKTLDQCVFIEPILHHGKGFDYFVMEEK